MPHLSDISLTSLAAVLIISIVGGFGWSVGGWVFAMISTIGRK
jgi:hypothetical protein